MFDPIVIYPRSEEEEQLADLYHSCWPLVEYCRTRGLDYDFLWELKEKLWSELVEEYRLRRMFEVSG